MAMLASIMTGNISISGLGDPCEESTIIATMASITTTMINGMSMRTSGNG